MKANLSFTRLVFMDITLLDNDMEGIEYEPSEKSLASCSLLDEISGDPQLIPRVGDQYQAEIRPLVGKCRSLQVVMQPVDSTAITNVPNPFPMGLPIPLFWTKTEVESINGASEFENIDERRITSSHGCGEYNVENLYPTLGDRKVMEENSELQPINRAKMDSGACPLPGSSSEVWKGIELDSFLLGLYIFGKNLILVKKIVESKGMGEILSFYYGKFYKSDGYRRWSECRKLRSRRCVHGQKLFTGWRQHELLSRLFSHISKECQDMLLEVSKKFGEGKVTFEEYVFAIRNTVGIGMLIKAVSIGKGKLDLTGNAMEPVKVNHVVSFRPEIPVGKACSSLTSVEIIKFLTGDFRLSKARSNDLFWEAVWPRLLARGWHSEQPKDQAFSGLKNSLVFLVPGVKKFSRRRLLKGDHYFDSVSDVLNKVASESGLLELENEGPKGSGDGLENKLDPVIKQDPDTNTTKDKRNCYLKPQKSGCIRDLMKFTIVDTSLVRGAERSKVREVRRLPLDATSLSTPSSISSDSEEDTSDDSEDETEETSTTNAPEAALANGRECVDISDCVNSNSNIVIPHTSNTSIISAKNQENQSRSLLHDLEEKAEKNDFSQKVKPSDSRYSVPVTKLRVLTDCINGESGCSVENISVDRMLNEDNSHRRSNSPDSSEDMVIQVGSQNLSPASSLSKGSPDQRKEGIVSENCLHIEGFPTKTRAHTLIDLNVPQVSTDFETDGPFISEMVQNSDNSYSHISFFQSEVTVQRESLNSKIPDKGAEVNQHPTPQNRRQSTRNRPLTTKALEALECGFFNPKRKRKPAEASQNNSRRVLSRPHVIANFRNGANNSNMGET
ncbi:uncharacterized protein LOC120173716 isoform X1 [Hibiscus syriacus]|uniref:uncharacterized protein LOC120173716 isoform X1 n=2 Tax=Hibiscus syriacus TaxID=106335 RepID=UPI0019222AC9|nr:uncharacterized protein LOC120173716 isoform X1 [Hibiscus syriacus]